MTFRIATPDHPAPEQDQIAARVAQLGDILAALASAAPDDRARLYGELGLTMIYDPGTSTVQLNVHPLPDMYVRECPRGNLNTNPRKISPNRGFHAGNATPVMPAASPLLTSSRPADPRMIKFYSGRLQSAPMRSSVLPSYTSEPRLVIVIRTWPLQLVWRSRGIVRGRRQGWWT